MSVDQLLPVLIGSHTSKQNLEMFLDHALNGTFIGFDVFQTSVSTMQSFVKGKPFSQSVIDKMQLYRNMRETDGKRFYGLIHGKYLYNFSRRDVQNQIDILISECRLANSIGCNIVIHQGKNVASENMTREDAIINFIDNMNRILTIMTNDTETISSRRLTDMKIVLENSAHQGTEIGYEISELAYIYNHINNDYKHMVSFCIDTCHAFVSGAMDCRDVLSVKSFFTQFDELIGLHKLEVIHFNDSASMFNSKNDHHEYIGLGYIGNPALGGSLNGYVEIIEMARNNNIPLVLEIPNPFDSAEALRKIIQAVRETYYINGGDKIAEIFTIPEYIDKFNEITEMYKQKSVKKQTKKVSTLSDPKSG